MPTYRNPFRIRELFTEEGVQRAADAILSYKRKAVLMVLLYAWGLFLGMVLTLLIVIRVALSLPMPWK